MHNRRERTMSGDKPSTTPDEISIRRAVRDRYGQLAQTNRVRQSCCEPEPVPSDPAALEASQVYAGCGSPVEMAALKEGEVVIDLGSGGGLDVFKASKLVGQSGLVIGVDATPEMVWRARETAKKHGFSNVEFRLGEIEHVPVDSNSADVVISNCVINLAPDKGAVFKEAYRILKPGGRLVVSDTIAEENLKVDRNDLNAWAECIAGALPEREYVALIREAGFADVQVTRKSPMQISGEGPHCCSQGITSVTITATAPKNVEGKPARIP